MNQIRKEWERFAVIQYDYGYTDEIPTHALGRAETLADAIRNSGVRCETCEHNNNGTCFTDHSFIGADGREIYPEFFCAHHSALAEDEK